MGYRYSLGLLLALEIFIPALSVFSDTNSTLLNVGLNPPVLPTNTTVFHPDTNHTSLLRIASEPAAPLGKTVVLEHQGVKNLSAEAIARKSIPVFFEEKYDSYKFRDRSGNDGVRTMTLNSGYISAFRRYLGPDDHGTNDFALPVLQMTIDYDESTGDYEVNRLGVGFFHERLWLMHEMGELDEDTSKYGIQLKQKW